MSANLDLVRSLYPAWERPDIEYVIADGPEPGNWKGLAGMAAGMREVLGAWEGYRDEAESFQALDEERVLVLVIRSGRGKGSGLEMGQIRTQGAGLFYIRDGKVTRLINYWDREHAFADLGLAPEDG